MLACSTGLLWSLPFGHLPNPRDDHCHSHPHNPTVSEMANSLKRTIGAAFRQRIRPRFAIEEAIEPSLGSNGAAMMEQLDAEGGSYRLGGV